jgi:solute carrier family 15 (peptide/histidine transporter), member 3/4
MFDGAQGLVILTVQARTPHLMPPPCSKSAGGAPPCAPVSGAKKAMLFAGLYLTALGVGGIKGSLPSHGAEQFDEHAPRGRKARSTFFNYFVFCLSCGALVAVTFAVWVEDNRGWQWGFGISTIAILLSVPVFAAGSGLYRNKVPTGSPLTTIAKVLLAVALARRGGAQSASNGAVIDRAPSPTGSTDMKDYCKPGEMMEIADAAAAAADQAEPSRELAFLNRAVRCQEEQPQQNGRLACTVQEVEDVKIVLMVLPIFFSTIMLNCCLAQLSTFSVEQAATMDTRVGRLTVPPASLPVFPVTFIILLAPVYDHVIVPFARRVTGTEMGISHLQRIGTGLVLSIVAMAVAAVVEVKRKNVAADSGMLDSPKPLPISFFWIAFQYLFLGSADLFTLAGLLEFFFSEAPSRMRSLATSLSWASLALGYYLSSVLVSIVNSATGRGGHRPWLQGASLNHYHLERFYWVMCVLSTLNYLFFLFWAIRYKYRNAGVIKG